jgi:hypothetical protein
MPIPHKARMGSDASPPSYLSFWGTMCATLPCLLVGCGGGGSGVRFLDAAVAAPVVLNQTSCEALGKVGAGTLPNATTVITNASFVPATAASGNSPAMPEHCLLQGSMNDRTGIDGMHYRIRFELRMPTAWNSRFFMNGGSGTNGTLSTANGSTGTGQPDTALQRGFAVVTTDGGHDNAVNTDPNRLDANAFGADPQARVDMGYNAYAQTVQVAKKLVAGYYGKAADKSYFVGCSEGGREAMILSQRFPTYFDGIVAGDPGFHLPKASGSMAAWSSQAFAAIAPGTDANGLPAVNKVFSDPDLLLLRQAILNTCDALDGAADGIVSNSAACQAAFDPLSARMPDGSPLACAGAKNDSCLTSAQLTTLKRVLGGPVNSSGQALYASYPWDAGFGGLSGSTYNQSWRSWWLGSYASSTNTAARFNGFSAASWQMVYSTPPTPMKASQLGAAVLAFNFDTDPLKIYATNSTFPASPMELGAAESTDLSAFRSHAGKMILYHGLSDASFSATDTTNWYNAMDARSGGSARDFARLFLVPGMGHCSGGPATDKFDVLTPLVNWVEKGAAPDSLVASAANPGYFNVSSRSRPLCPYPKFARYTGSGDINDAANFYCQSP